MIKNYFLNLVYSLLLISLISCNSNDNTDSSEEQDSSQDFKVVNLLSSITQTQILPSVASFVEEVNLLSELINSYTNETSENKLEEIKNQWKLVALSYEKIYIYNIGEVRNNFLHQAIYSWPILVSSIENIIETNTIIDSELIASQSPQVKSIAALEYLLFNSDTSLTNSQFDESQKRKDYLRLSAVNLLQEAVRLQNIWLPSGGDFANLFINNSRTGIQGSFNQLFNGIYNLIDTGKVSKIGKPAGLENSSNSNPDLSQAFLSELSLPIIKSNMESIQKAYFNPDGIGFDDYVFSISQNSQINDLVQSKINEVNNAIDLIPSNLYSAITDNPSTVENLHTKLKELLVVFGVDLRSILSVVITSTDNDGD